MKPNKTVRILTLITFILLIISVVTFKSGAFNNYWNSDDDSVKVNDSKTNIPKIQVDTPSLKSIDTIKVNPTMMSTSKSIIMTDQKIEFNIEDTQNLNDY